MAVTRAGLLAYLAGALHKIATEAGHLETDAPDGYGYAIDSVFAALGVPVTDATTQLPDSLTAPARALAYYHGLFAIYTDLSSVIDKSTRMVGDETVITDRRSLLFSQVGTLLKEAQARAAGFGYSLEVQSRLQIGRLTLDYNRANPARRALGDGW